MGGHDGDYIHAYNIELGQFGSSIRVAKPGRYWHDGSLELFDATGVSLGCLPDTIEPRECAAIAQLIEAAFRRGRDAACIDTPPIEETGIHVPATAWAGLMRNSDRPASLHPDRRQRRSGGIFRP